MINEKIIEYSQNALTFVMEACSGEKLLVISDNEKKEIGQIFAYAGLEIGLYTRSISLGSEKKIFRTELSNFLKEVVVNSNSNIVINCLRGPFEETPFRIKLIHLITKDKDRRLAHGPGITLDMFTDGALALSIEDYQKINDSASRLMTATEGASEIIITSSRGTNLDMSIQGRSFFTDINITNKKWGNLPVGEITVGPVENSLNGELVCDVAIGGIGPIDNPIIIKCVNGKATEVRTDDQNIQKKVRNTLQTDSMASIVGEMAIGINPKARVIEEFLETEKVLGTAHIAFGRNIDFPTGGNNNSANHMDFLIDEPTIYAVFPNKNEKKITSKGKIIV